MIRATCVSSPLRSAYSTKFPNSRTSSDYNPGGHANKFLGQSGVEFLFETLQSLICECERIPIKIERRSVAEKDGDCRLRPCGIFINKVGKHRARVMFPSGEHASRVGREKEKGIEVTYHRYGITIQNRATSMNAGRVYRVPYRSPNSIDLSSPSMCLSNDNKLPNECVQSYSIIATTGGGHRRSMKRPTGVRIREKVEGEEAT